jgi:hypothetical protein
VKTPIADPHLHRVRREPLLCGQHGLLHLRHAIGNPFCSLGQLLLIKPQALKRAAVRRRISAVRPATETS